MINSATPDSQPLKARTLGSWGRLGAGAAVAVLLTTVCSTAGAQKATTRTVKFAGGETVIESGSDTDHVIVRNAQGEAAAESWCESGTYDSYLALFTRLKDVTTRGDRAAVVKLVVYPLRVYTKKTAVFRSDAALLKSYDTVFTPQVLGAIATAEPAAVFCRDGQGMLGNGVVWATAAHGRARVASINQ